MSSVDRESLPPMPRTLFGYDVIDVIGQGAGSVIYAVSDVYTKQLLAAKHVVRKNDKDIRFVEQVENEFEISKRFESPYLRRSIDLKINKSMLWKVTEALLVMELFDGQPLDVALPGSIPAKVRLFIDVARGLDALHGMGFVHCDLKPNNILVSPAGTIKIIDFGQACPVGTAKVRIQGTPDYIAPEQVRRLPVSIRTDVFNYGATFYWALTGRKLPTLYTAGRKDNSFLVDDVMATPEQIDKRVPTALSSLVMDCCRTNPTKRPANMTEIIRRLEIMLVALGRRQSDSKVSVA
jgi:serine/threonine protein kinase